ncbi:MAG: bifunctional phosphopantothenoylcysteine decarboxylase/phosphopantothenate--cysteine ligase CoaBC [Finegoldia sp.]|nr:bifunctional phosphopantothenoylcysteine decarboxylase/phosphopantothenate--cysteine ligase CoaBC [Finegoldia sp.]
MKNQNKRILLGVTAGVAIYKVLDLISRLKKKSYQVDVIMTESASKMISPILFETMAKSRVYVDMFDEKSHERVKHIDLARQADLFVIAPATANTMAKIANGIADNMLTTTALAYDKEIMFCVSMNTNMLHNPITVENIEKLRQRGHIIVSSNSGILACDSIGDGRLKEPYEIVEEIEAYFTEKDLKGKNILVTAGGTVERIDPVRYITNDSSGKMGYAIAKRAYMRGAAVRLISARTSVDLPYGIEEIKLDSALAMKEEIEKNMAWADSLIMAAAVSDYRVKNPSAQKIKKQGSGFEIELEENPDILKSIKKREDQTIIGFAAESRDLVANAMKKLESKNLDYIVANDISIKDIGFNSDNNQVLILGKDFTKRTDKMTKEDIADTILDLLK